MSTPTKAATRYMTRSRITGTQLTFSESIPLVTPLRASSNPLLSEDASANTPRKRGRPAIRKQSSLVVVSPEADKKQPAPKDAPKKDASPPKKIIKKEETESKKSKSPSPRKRTAKATTTTTTTTTSTAKPPPVGWQEIYSLVEELRQDKSAPVDTDGGEILPDKFTSPETHRFQVLIALMLSSQTKDAVVGEAMRNLQAHGLTVEKIAETSPETLNELIRKVGFHNNKTKYIKQVVEILQSEYNSDIPPTADEMIRKLPGVGPKMAYLVENIAWKRVSGIGVDTHMHRIFNELKWVQSKNPEQTRIQLEQWLPRDRWVKVNYLWVGFGQEVQQFKPKMLKKVLACSRPADGLRLVKRLGLDYVKEGAKLGLEEEIRQALAKK